MPDFAGFFTGGEFMGIDVESGPGRAPRSVQTGDMIEFKYFERDGLWRDVYDCPPYPDSRAESGKIRHIAGFCRIFTEAEFGLRRVPGKAGVVPIGS